MRTILFAFTIVSISCVARAQEATVAEKSQNSDASEKLSLAGLNATLWAQGSIEYPAVTTGAYRQAERSLNEALADATWSAVPVQEAWLKKPENKVALPPAVILDVDETVLMNYPFQAWLVESGQEFNLPRWNLWVSQARAEPVPGVIEFVNHCREKGVRVLYVTNRDYRGPIDLDFDGEISDDESEQELKPFTIRNLRKHKLLPQEGLSDEESLLLRGEKDAWASSDKTNRRNELLEKYRILLLIGDTLGDFTSGPDGDLYKTQRRSQRERTMVKHQHRWGRSWIMIPNASYGYWQREPYKFKDELPARKRLQRQINALSPWYYRG